MMLRETETAAGQDLNLRLTSLRVTKDRRRRALSYRDWPPSELRRRSPDAVTQFTL